jgi:hypothetical protein
MDLKKDLNDLKTDHTATVSELKKATTKFSVLSNKLDEDAAVKKELGLLADRLEKKLASLSFPKPKLPKYSDGFSLCTLLQLSKS